MALQLQAGVLTEEVVLAVQELVEVRGLSLWDSCCLLGSSRLSLLTLASNVASFFGA